MKFGTRLKETEISNFIAKIREFNFVMKINFLGDEISKENVH